MTTLLLLLVVDTISARAALPALVCRFKIRLESEQIAITRRNLHDTGADGLARFEHRAESANMCTTDQIEKMIERRKHGMLSIVDSDPRSGF